MEYLVNLAANICELEKLFAFYFFGMYYFNEISVWFFIPYLLDIIKIGSQNNLSKSELEIVIGKSDPNDPRNLTILVT